MQPRKDLIRAKAAEAEKPKRRKVMTFSNESEAPDPKPAEGLPATPPATPPLSTAPAGVPDRGPSPSEARPASTAPVDVPDPKRSPSDTQSASTARAKVPDPRWGTANAVKKL